MTVTLGRKQAVTTASVTGIIDPHKGVYALSRFWDNEVLSGLLGERCHAAVSRLALEKKGGRK